jgi:hypothetical protein
VRWWGSLASIAASAGLAGLAGVAGLATMAACHGAVPATGPSTRPDPVSSCKVSSPVCDPTVSTEVAVAVVQHRCAGCHAEGGAASHPLLEPGALVLERGNVALRLAGCEMPPDATPLPADDRARLVGWGACAPETSAPAAK